MEFNFHVPTLSFLIICKALAKLLYLASLRASTYEEMVTTLT